MVQDGWDVESVTVVERGEKIYGGVRIQKVLSNTLTLIYKTDIENQVCDQQDSAASGRLREESTQGTCTQRTAVKEDHTQSANCDTMCNSFSNADIQRSTGTNI